MNEVLFSLTEAVEPAFDEIFDTDLVFPSSSPVVLSDLDTEEVSN